jgi:hypothetical protein
MPSARRRPTDDQPAAYLTGKSKEEPCRTARDPAGSSGPHNLMTQGAGGVIARPVRRAGFVTGVSGVQA